MLTPNVTLASLEMPDFPVLRQLAATIWRQHYQGIVSAAQVEYMLTGRLSDEALLEQACAADRWLEILRVSDVPVGYCACELADADSDGERAAMKLGQLYVLESHRGRGFGRYMLDHVADRARTLGRGVLFLQVNKRNTDAIRFYEATGFRIAREAVFDIGSGFVMDDYVMEKRL